MTDGEDGVAPSEAVASLGSPQTTTDATDDGSTGSTDADGSNGGDSDGSGSSLIDGLLSTEPHVAPERMDMPPAAAHAYAGTRKFLAEFGVGESENAEGTPAVMHFGRAAQAFISGGDEDRGEDNTDEVRPGGGPA